MLRRKVAYVLMSAILTGSILLAGCGNVKMTSEDQTKFVTEITTMVNENQKLSDCISKVDSKIKNMDKDKSSQVVDEIITLMHLNLEPMNYKVQAFQQDLKTLEEKKIDLNSKDAIEKSSNASVKGLLQELQEKKLIIKSEAGKYYLIPNLKFVDDKYKDYMNDDLKEVVEFRLEENDNPVFKQQAESFDLELLGKRLKKAQDNQKKYEKSVYYKQWLQYEEIYYGIMFGKSHPFFLDSNKKVIDSVIKFYEKVVKDYPDSQMGKDVKVYLEALNKNGNIVNDEVSKTSDALFKRVEDNFNKIYLEEQSKQNKETESKIKDAIKDNSGKDADKKSDTAPSSKPAQGETKK